MKRFVFLMAFLGLSVALMAQYYAYTMNGRVQLMRGGAWQEVFVTMELQETDLVQTEPYGNLTILDRTNNRVYSIQSEDAKPLGLLMQRQKGTRTLVAEYIIGMYNKLFGIEEERTKGEKTEGGVTYRGEEEEREIARALIHARRSAYPVSFLLLDFTTREPVDRVREGQMVIVQLNNMSDTPLYMNIIDTDARGTAAALFPLNEKQTMFSLYVPAFSNVRLDEYPLAFAPAGTTDKLRLVAYPYPFDLTNVLEKMMLPEIREASGRLTPVGMFMQPVLITQ